MRRLLPILVIAACGGGSRMSSGTLAGATWWTEQASGRFCESCGPTVQATVGGSDQSNVFIEVDGVRCLDGAPWKDDLSVASSVRISYGPPGGERVAGVGGQATIHECSRDRLRLDFSVRFEDGSRAEGSVATSLD